MTVAMVAFGIGTALPPALQLALQWQLSAFQNRAFISMLLLWVTRHCGITMHYNALK